MKETKEQIINENAQRFLDSAKKYNKLMHLGIPEEEIDVEKAKEIMKKYFKWADNKNLARAHIETSEEKRERERLERIKHEKQAKENKKIPLQSLKYSKSGSIKI